MKTFYTIIFFAILEFACVGGCAQATGNTGDLLSKAEPDTNQVKILIELSKSYYFNKPDSCFIFAKKAVELARELNYTKGELRALNTAGEALRFLGEFPQALEMQFDALQINKTNADKNGEATTLSFIGIIYLELNEYRQALDYMFQSVKIYNSISNPIMTTFNFSNIGNAYEGLNMLDSALFFQQKAQDISQEFKHGNLKVLIKTRLGIVYERFGKQEEALKYYHEALQDAELIGDQVNPSKIQNRMAESYLVLHKKDSALLYAKRSILSGLKISQKLQVLESANLLVKLFRDLNMPDSLIYYQDIAIAMNDSLYGPAKFRQLQLLTLKEQLQQQEILKEQERNKTKTKMLALLAGLAVFLVIAVILFRNNRQKQRANAHIEKAYTNLKATQQQLIQSEKMASLGELTAGIAHEIQNPLNFVNNFSDVNKELLTEMKEEIEKGNLAEAKSIADNVIQNQDKVNHHGKRADAIVKNMLQHSRASSGKKELTDINALAEEYLRLAYHGLRAKDKSFNAKFETELDPVIGKIYIVPQDMGRVLLNLINNAFHAVAERKSQEPGFDPLVSIVTKKSNGFVEITVRDNGNGIPPANLDKIFQPFFTTKPTGEGTGLGLSLSYDIVKAHGGELKVETKQGIGSDFIILLPVNS